MGKSSGASAKWFNFLQTRIGELYPRPPIQYKAKMKVGDEGSEMLFYESSYTDVPEQIYDRDYDNAVPPYPDAMALLHDFEVYFTQVDGENADEVIKRAIQKSTYALLSPKIVHKIARWKLDGTTDSSAKIKTALSPLLKTERGVASRESMEATARRAKRMYLLVCAAMNRGATRTQAVEFASRKCNRSVDLVQKYYSYYEQLLYGKYSPGPERDTRAVNKAISENSLAWSVRSESKRILPSETVYSIWNDYTNELAQIGDDITGELGERLRIRYATELNMDTWHFGLMILSCNAELLKARDNLVGRNNVYHLVSAWRHCVGTNSNDVLPQRSDIDPLLEELFGLGTTWYNIYSQFERYKELRQFKFGVNYEKYNGLARKSIDPSRISVPKHPPYDLRGSLKRRYAAYSAMIKQYYYIETCLNGQEPDTTFEAYLGQLP